MSSLSTDLCYSLLIRQAVEGFEKQYPAILKGLTALGGDRERWVVKAGTMGDLTKYKKEDLEPVLNSQLDRFNSYEDLQKAGVELSELIQKVIAACPKEKISEAELTNFKRSAYNVEYAIDSRNVLISIRGQLSALDVKVAFVTSRFQKRNAAAKPEFGLFCYPIANQMGKLGTIDLSHLSSNICLGRLLDERRTEMKKAKDAGEQKQDADAQKQWGAKVELERLQALEGQLNKLINEDLFDHLEGKPPAPKPPAPPAGKPPAVTDKDKSAAATAPNK